MSHDPHRVALLFAAAMAKPSPRERAAYLDEACAGDSEMRRLVEEMLTVHDAADGPPDPSQAPLAVTVDASEAVEGPGMRIGPFKLLQRLGEGGMGTVYMAEQERPVTRRVALKIIKAGMDSAQVAARFEQERQALAVMDHPNIAKVFDAGATATGRPFFVMELVKGISITRFCDQERLTPKERLELFMPVCLAVQHAHAKGIIHRDLKPSNVLVALYDGKPVPKVIDFGVAKATGQKLTERTLFTEVGRIVGTLEYMAPEQAELNNLDIDTRADVYSLGALLYELLTGSPPFSAKQLRGAAHDEMLRMIREVDPPKPSTRLSSSGELPSIAANRKLEPRGLTSLVTGELDWIVMKALEKERGRRYETAHALAMDLQHFLSNEPVVAGPPSAGYRLRKFLRRNQGPVAAAMLVLVVLVGGMIGTSWGLVRATGAGKEEARQRQIAQDKERDALAAEKRAIGERDKANAARESELRQLYASDMLVASRAASDGPLSRALELLDAWRPERRGGEDLRGREWHMLRRLCDTSETTMIGHNGALRALAWTADGKRIASGGADRIVRVWDSDTGDCLRTLVGHSAGVFDVAFSPDGKLLASAGADCTVRLWEVDTGRERHVLRGHILPVYAVVFHGDGNRFASAGGDTVIKLWDAATGNELDSLQGHEAAVGKLQFDAAGKQLASCGIIGGTLLWDLDTRKVADRLEPNGDFVLTHDFATGFFAYPTGTIGFMGVKTKVIDQGGLGLNGIHAIDLSDTARIAAIAGTDDGIHVIDRDTASILARHRGHFGPARRVVLRAGGRKLASAGDDGTVRIWDLPDPDNPRPYSAHHEHNVSSLAFSQDGALLATGDYLGSIAIWDHQTGQRAQILGSHFIRRKSDEKAVEIGTGKPLLDGTRIKSKVGYSAGTAKNPIIEMIVAQGHAAEIKGLAFTPDKKVLVSAGATEIIIWDLESAKPPKEIKHPSLVSSLAVSPDGALAATGCWDDIVRVYRVPSGELVKELEGHGDDVMCVAFHPSGKELASGSRDRTAIVWDVETGTIKHRLRRHFNTVSAVRYAPGGKRLVTGGMDKAIHVWNAATATHESTLHGHNEGVTGLEFSTDGKWLVSACNGTTDTSARVWLWNFSRFREGPLIQSGFNQGPTALAIHPLSGDLLIGRQTLSNLTTKPWVERPTSTAEPIDPEVIRAKTPTDSRLMVLGYTIVDELPAWPDSHKGRLKAEQPGGKFLVVATSLPFSRLKLSDTDYARFLEMKRNDEDAADPLKFSSVLIYPRRFVLSDADEKAVPAQFVGRMALAREQGFEFMAKGVSMLENMTATPQSEDRQLVYVGWEVGEAFPTNGLRLRFEDDEPVEVPSLVLETFRPGKPFHPASRGFDAGEEGNRLRSQTTRSPGL